MGWREAGRQRAARGLAPGRQPGRQASKLWPLGEGAVHPGVRFSQAELHLHRGGLLPAAPCLNASLKVTGSPRTRPWLARRRRGDVGWVPPPWLHAPASPCAWPDLST